MKLDPNLVRNFRTLLDRIGESESPDGRLIFLAVRLLEADDKDEYSISAHEAAGIVAVAQRMLEFFAVLCERERQLEGAQESRTSRASLN